MLRYSNLGAMRGLLHPYGILNQNPSAHTHTHWHEPSSSVQRHSISTLYSEIPDPKPIPHIQSRVQMASPLLTALEREIISLPLIVLITHSLPLSSLFTRSLRVFNVFPAVIALSYAALLSLSSPPPTFLLQTVSSFLFGLDETGWPNRETIIPASS